MDLKALRPISLATLTLHAPCCSCGLNTPSDQLLVDTSTTPGKLYCEACIEAEVDVRRASNRPSPAVCAVVDRCHVSTSRMGVLRYLRSRWKPEVRRDPALKAVRHATMREALARHEENRRLFVTVQMGAL